MIKLLDLLNEEFKPSDYDRAKRAVQKTIGNTYTLKLYNEDDMDRDWSDSKRLSREGAREVGIYVYTKGRSGELFGYGAIDMDTKLWYVSLDSGAQYKGRI